MVVSHKLGRVVEHDPRSRSFEAVVALVQRSVLHAHHAPILDQGELGSCTGNALAQALNCDYFRTDDPLVPYLNETDAVRIYSTATSLDGVPGKYPPDDTGSSGLAVCKAGRRLGLLSSYRWVFSFTSFCAALQKQPMIVGIAWYEGMFRPNRQGFVVPSGALAGGHELCALGVDYPTQAITLLNSWGERWGQNGRCKIGFKDFAHLLSQQGDATVPLR